MESLLEIVLVLLLALTLFHAFRLERALGVLQRDRGALEELIGRFNSSTRQAEQGVEQLRAAAEGACRQITRQMEIGVKLKDDLVFLLERGETLAERLDGLVRAARPFAAEAGRPEWAPREAIPFREPGAPEHSLGRPMGAEPWPDVPTRAETSRDGALRAEVAAAGVEHPPRVRSQAERDLLNALRAVR